MSTGTFTQFQSARRSRWGLLVLLFAALLTSGCGKEKPIDVQLRKQGVTFEYASKDKKDKIIKIRFPKNADDKMVAALQEQIFDDVQDVDLSGTKITDQALESLKYRNSLSKLNLNNTTITDEGLAHLSELTSLTHLDLSDTHITGAGLKSLHKLSGLQVLNLLGKPKPKVPARRGFDTAFRLGIDLAGGTNLVYQVIPTPDKPIIAESMEQMVAAVKRRLDPAGTEEITVRKVGSDRIEVIIPRADPEVVKEKKRMMTRLGSLEFALLANQQDNEHTKWITKAQATTARDIRDPSGKIIVAGWREVAVGPTGIPKEVRGGGTSVTRQSPTNKDLIEFLVIFSKEKDKVTGKLLTRASASTDENARPSVSFTFNAKGGTRFARLTGDHLPSAEGGTEWRLAILLDGHVHSAPSIKSIIPDGRGEITGSFTSEEVRELVNVLNAGALVLDFKKDPTTNRPTPISEQSVSPTLGADVQQKGKFAIGAAALCVVVFMLAYYMFAGIVADICLIINLVLVMGAMVFIDAAFTLPGLAGIVLTIGMAVDANVLIFERIREEQNRGSSLRMAIHNGFSKAFTTIVDANLTTLITAVVLYLIGTDQVRGFAVTLFIGIVMSMFSALFIGRLIFDIFERKRWLKKLSMNSVVGVTKWDFLAKKSIAGMVSAVIIIAGVIGLFSRGSDLLNIDFSGGTMVTFEFKEQQDYDDIKKILAKSEILNDGLSVEELTLASEVGTENAHKRFRARGKESDRQKFQQAIIDILKKENDKKYALRQVQIVKFNAAMLQPIQSATKKDDKENLLSAPKITDYDGGYKVQLSFTEDGLKLATFRDYISRHLGEISTATKEEEESSAKYTQVEELFKVVGVGDATGESSGDDPKKYHTILLTTKETIDKADLINALTKLQTELAAAPVFPEVNNFDASVASDMQQSAILAMLFSLLAIIAYIWFRFKQATFGIAAVAALLHDVFIVLGIVALAPYLGLGDFKLDLPMIAAFLTIVGYSLNDTIVVFDRIREVRGKNPALTNEIVNTSLNQTLSRTILTSLTTFVVVVILFFAGGEGIHGFAFCLVLGVIVGTYSSIYIASPVLLWLMNRPSGATTPATQPTKNANATA